jgi:GNAT superfamily N-acetyltransferase
MCKFTDSKGRDIESRLDTDFEAWHRGKRVGYISIDDEDDPIGPGSRPRLSGMAVDPEYQHSGIGTALMKLAVGVHGKHLLRPRINFQGGLKHEPHAYFTADGRAFIEHCIEIGLLLADEPEWGPGEELED